MKVGLVWATPNGDDLIAYMARVSNPKNQDNTATAPRLISFLLRNRHFSPFEMVGACLEIECSRDISRQILRHRSFTYQEFSQRYAEVPDAPVLREARLQDEKNRQASILTDDAGLISAWEADQREVWEFAQKRYRRALKRGMAKEQARALLPEGMSPTRMYMNGTLRSWIHFHSVRTDISAQKEVRDVAHAAGEILEQSFPATWEAVRLSAN